MKEHTELISVILAVYNVEKYLPACLESILKQAYGQIEIVAIDDFSKDNSYHILHEYKRKDQRVRCYRNVKRYGMALTLNRALKRALGKFVIFMNAEDVVHSQKFQQQIGFLLARDNVVAVGTQCLYVDDQNKKAGKSTFPESFLDIYKKPLHGASFLFETLMINKYRIPKDLLYFKTNKHPYLYADIFMKLMKYGEITNLPHYLYFHRLLSSKKQKPSPQNIPFLLKLWIRSMALHDVTPSFKSLFLPQIKTKVS